MKKFIILTVLLAMPLVGCSTRERTTSTEASEASKDWTQRRDEFVTGSQAKLDGIYQNVAGLEKRGKLLNNRDARKVKNEAEDLREDIVDLKKELAEDARKVSAKDWEEERLDIQSDINNVEQKYNELSSRYKR